MRQRYIRKLRIIFPVSAGRCAVQMWTNCTVFDFIFWHIAEFASTQKNLLLIGTARSYLTVKLPNVDPGTGGECG